ncbi:MAG: hypothetical protein K2M60_03520 [Lachnospiraceae bacterium]|nr:hypothetical protein [Lachnospiraceae bacterium]MDE6251599.1 hypothetical protein [Lachnospiraceae bacterium]
MGKISTGILQGTRQRDNSKFKHILEECPRLRDCQLSEGDLSIRIASWN